MTIALSPSINAAHEEELARLEILRAYKQQFAGDGTANRSPFSERVVRYETDVTAWDVPEIHRPVREALKETLVELHQGHSSRVVIFAGPVGMGKSHLLNCFRDPERQKDLGYISVSNPNNFWKVEEFEECLLTWLVAALVQPSLHGPNLLQEKIEDIAFQALEQILDQPGTLRQYLKGKVAGWWARLLGKFGRDKHARFRQACLDRDVNIFRRLDFHRFAGFVCKRFLHEETNFFHRFVLELLLRYLFPEDRDKVCAWLVGQKVRASFLRQISSFPKVNRQALASEMTWPTDTQVEAHLLHEVGVSDRLDRNYKLIETIKILINLFSPDMDRHRSAGAKGHAGRVFFFAFDQVEGREKLFEKEGDWVKFFDKLSELYNALPNVFVVFTMTTDLRNLLYPRMERQFQQRIHRDQKFVLQDVEDSDILAIYRRRVELWRGESLPQIEELVTRPLFHYLPFTQEEVLARGRRMTLRKMQETFDHDFRDYLNKIVVDADARLEYLVALNEQREQEKDAKPFDYTEENIDHVAALLKRTDDVLARAFGLSLSGIEMAKTEEGYPALRLELRKSPADERWVRIFIARLPFRYTARAESYLGLLFHRQMDRNFLWLVRPGPIAEDWENRKPGQIFARTIDNSQESRLIALLSLLDKEDGLPNTLNLTDEERNLFRHKAGQILAEEIKLTYLGELLQNASEALDLLEGKDAEGISLTDADQSTATRDSERLGGPSDDDE
jgi:hypothetical protein